MTVKDSIKSLLQEQWDPIEEYLENNREEIRTEPPACTMTKQKKNKKKEKERKRKKENKEQKYSRIVYFIVLCLFFFSKADW